MADEIEVIHNPSRKRFEAHVDAKICHLDYRLDDGVMIIHHTEVPPSVGGRGIGGRLVEVAVAYARDNGLRVLPACSYVRAWMQRHSAALDLLPPGTSGA